MSYLKPQYPLSNANGSFYPLTTADQVLLSDGTRLEKGGRVVADVSANSEMLDGKDAKYYIQPRNLLDNSWWKVQKEIVNQRGQTEYTSNGYTIDRWEIYDGAVGVTSLGYITTSGQMYQKIDIPTDKVYTFAVENDAGIAVVTGIPANGIHSATLGNALIKLATIGEYVEVVIEPSEGYDIAGAYWAALYEGEYTAETLPPYRPKGYAAELAECRRYYKPYNSFWAIGYVITGAGYIIVESLGHMRTKPTVITSGTVQIYNSAIGWVDTSIEDIIQKDDRYWITLPWNANLSNTFVLVNGIAGLSADL